MAEEKPRGARLIRNSLFSLTSEGINMVLAFGASVVIARILKPELYGIYNLLLWLNGLVLWAISLGLINSITKFVAEFRGKGRHADISAIVVFVLRVELVLCLVVTTILIFFRTQIADYFFSPTQSFYFLLAFVGLVPGILTAIFSATIEGVQHFEYFTRYHLVAAPVSFLAKMGALYMGYRLGGILVVTLVFSFINTVYFAWACHRQGIHLNLFGHKLNKSTRKEIGKYNLSVSAIQIVDKVIWDKSENFFLGRYCHATQIAYYNLAYNVSQRFLMMLPNTFWRVLFPTMSEYFGAGDKEKMHRLFYVATRYLAFFSFPIGTAGIVLAFPALHFFYGHEYTAAKYALQIFFFSGMITSLTQPGSAILYGTGRQPFILKYGLILSILNISLDFLIIRRYGALGAAICCGSVTIAGAVGGLYYTCRSVKLRFPFKSIFKISFSTILMALTMSLVSGHKAELLGFILSIPLGVVVYIVSSVVMGSLEEEDLILLRSFSRALPEPLQKWAASGLIFLLSFKEGGSSV